MVVVPVKENCSTARGRGGLKADEPWLRHFRQMLSRFREGAMVKKYGSLAESVGGQSQRPTLDNDAGSWFCMVVSPQMPRLRPSHSMANRRGVKGPLTLRLRLPLTRQFSCCVKDTVSHLRGFARSFTRGKGSDRVSCRWRRKRSGPPRRGVGRSTGHHGDQSG